MLSVFRNFAIPDDLDDFPDVQTLPPPTHLPTRTSTRGQEKKLKDTSTSSSSTNNKQHYSLSGETRGFD